MITLDISPLRVAFSRNPIFLHFREVAQARYTITTGGESFSGVVDGDADINIAEVVDAILPDVPLTTEDGNVIVNATENKEAFNVCVDVELPGTDEKWHKSFYCLKGGISNQNHMVFHNAGSDVFQCRFLNYNGNFFLTTRSHKWRIIMKETEVSPLYFISKGGEMRVSELASGKSCEFELPMNTIAALDIHALRQYFISSFGILANAFDIFVNGQRSCRIIIELCPPYKDIITLRFRNSLGVPEHIALACEPKLSIPKDNEDSASIKSYDAVSDSFHDRQLRSETSLTWKAAVNIKPHEFTFLCDMLASEDVTLIYKDLSPERVIVSADITDYPVRPTKPMTFNLSIRFCAPEINCSEPINSIYSSKKPRVFSSAFSKQFN